jgi:hypothetical protein
MTLKITELARDATAGGARIHAVVEWEDTPRPPVTLELEVDGPPAADLAPEPAAFVVAAAVPAFHAGERRLAVTGALSPRLRDGLSAATQLLGRWWGPARAPLLLEPTEGFRPGRPTPATQTALFLSGGVDSLCSLRLNRRAYPLDHPWAVRAGLVVYGLDIGHPRAGAQDHFFERAVEALRPAAAETALDLVVLRTNVRGLAEDLVSWPDQWVGAATTALAHALTRRLGRALLASSLDLRDLAPCGTHPLLDPAYSSEALEIVHDGAHLSRLEKIGVVAGWPTALAGLRVCFEILPPEGPLNCGRCLKCVRTMLGLIAHGAFAAATTFPVRDVTPEMVEATPMVSARNLVFYRSVIGPLEARGRRDLADAVRRHIRAWERARAWHDDTGWKGRLRRLDRQWLGGTLQHVSRLVRGGSTHASRRAAGH